MRQAFFGFCLAATLAGSAAGEPAFVYIPPVAIPNFAGVGIGGVPDYLGSDNYTAGVAPFGRYSWGNRYVDLQANYLRVNLLDDASWNVGPSAILRFGRDDVDDPVVDRLPDIDTSLDLGAFVSYSVINPQEPRDRWVFSADAAHDVTGAHSGYTLSASARRWYPLGNFAAFGLSVASTYGSEDYMDTYFSVTPAGASASGLAPFAADAGVRDIRVTAVVMQPLSEKWVVGGGVMYMRLVGDASDTPITGDRGSADQFFFGLALAHVF